MDDRKEGNQMVKAIDFVLKIFMREARARLPHSWVSSIGSRLYRLPPALKPSGSPGLPYPGGPVGDYPSGFFKAEAGPHSIGRSII